MTEFDGSDSDSREKKFMEYVRYAYTTVDKHGRIQSTLDYYDERKEQVEAGKLTEPDMFSNDSDAIYHDHELADRIANLRQRLESALIAVTALAEAEDLVRDRKNELKDDEFHARVVAARMADTATEMTIADLFPSEKDK